MKHPDRIDAEEIIFKKLERIRICYPEILLNFLEDLNERRPHFKQMFNKKFSI